MRTFYKLCVCVCVCVCVYVCVCVWLKTNETPSALSFRVNAIFSGHVHGYERTKNVAFSAIDETGPMYVIIGDGGNREGHSSGFLDHNPPVWSAFRDNTVFGLGALTLQSNKKAVWTWIKNVNETKLFAEADSVTLENQYFL